VVDNERLRITITRETASVVVAFVGDLDVYAAARGVPMTVRNVTASVEALVHLTGLDALLEDDGDLMSNWTS
jgi:hypothetical protein